MTKVPYKIFSDSIEGGAINQFHEALAHESVIRGALMPDAHKGYSLPIGGVVLTDGFVFPSWVGFDIGCGVCAIKTNLMSREVHAYRQEIFDGIYEAIPVGYNHNQNNVEWNGLGRFNFSHALVQIYMETSAAKQLGTLGGGNHFIEIGQDETNHVWVIIHSGSRNLGHRVATHYMKLASPTGKASEGNFGFPLRTYEGISYWTDMNFCLEFALENRLEMLRRIQKVLQSWSDYEVDFDWENVINRTHNHATMAPDKSGIIHRKGATHAELGMKGVIPGNMRDGSFIVEGLGNSDSLWSSSHGAGRILGRKVAKETLSIDDFTSTMAISDVLANVSENTLDESPMAYKDIFDVMHLQKDLVRKWNHIKPIINIKGG